MRTLVFIFAAHSKVLSIKAAFVTYNDMQFISSYITRDKSLIRSFCALVVAVCPFCAFVLFSGHVLVAYRVF